MANNRYNLEEDMNNSTPRRGLKRYHDIPIPLWMAATLDSLSSGTTPKRAHTSTSAPVIQYAFGAGAAAPILAVFEVPHDFYDPDLASDRVFKLEVYCRKRDTAADENPTLALQLAVSIWRNEAAVTGLSADMNSGALPAAVIAAATDGSGFTKITFDIAAALAADGGKRVRRGDVIRLALYPSATVGTTDMVFEIKKTRVVCRQHIANFLTTDR